MKTKLIGLFILFSAAFTAVAATITNVASGIITTNAALPADAPLPSTTADFWKYAIAVVVPILVNVFKKLVPNIPPWLLPVSTPFLGMALGAGLKALGASHMGWVDLAEAGGLAVLVRESFNQIVVKRLGTKKDAE